MVGRRSLLGEAEKLLNLRKKIETEVTRSAPRFANDREFNASSCMAGSSESISPLESKRFKHVQWGQRNDRGSRGKGDMICWQKKQET